MLTRKAFVTLVSFVVKLMRNPDLIKRAPWPKRENFCAVGVFRG